MIRKILFVAAVAAFISLTGCEQEHKKNEKQIQESEPVMTKQNDDQNKPVKIRMETSKGDIVIELNPEKAPVTCKNFLQYINDKFYDGTIFHRVIKGFMIQGGGMTADMKQKRTNPPIVNEAKNGLKNDRGTIAMARTADPDSATAQFFINHADNDFLNFGARDEGYAVFGKVIEGMDVVDAIAEVKTRPGDVPVEAVTIKSVNVE